MVATTALTTSVISQYLTLWPFPRPRLLCTKILLVMLRIEMFCENT